MAVISPRAARTRTVRLWPIDGGECRVLRGHTDEVYAVAYHPDGTRLATGGHDGSRDEEDPRRDARREHRGQVRERSDEERERHSEAIVPLDASLETF